MRKILRTIAVLLITIIFVPIANGQKLISGLVKDRTGNSLSGVNIKGETNNVQSVKRWYSYSDSDGAFHYFSNNPESDTLVFTEEGYYNYTLTRLDTIRTPLKIVLTIDPFYVNHENVKSENASFGNFAFQFGFDIIPLNFDEFQSVLGDSNIAMLNKGDVFFNLGFSYFKKKNYFNASIGIMGLKVPEYSDDTMNRKVNLTQYRFTYGRVLLDTKHVKIYPEVSLSWCKYRLLNSPFEYKQSLNSYVEKPSMDIRFNQVIGRIGANFEYIIGYNEGFKFGIQLAGGYLTKLNYEPWVYSHSNRLTSDGFIKYDEYYFNISFLFYMN